MRIFLNILLICCIYQSSAQSESTTSKKDTILLRSFTTNKVVSYKYRNLVFTVPYQSFKDATFKLKEELHLLQQPYRRRGHKALRELQKQLHKQSAFSDTIVLSHSVLETAISGDKAYAQIKVLERYFADQMKEGSCNVSDGTGRFETMVLREKYTFGRLVAGHQGRRFYLTGQAFFFIETIDLVF
jgi:hypothetical protein